MRLDELRAACSAENPLDGKPVSHVYLVVPRKSLPRGSSIGLCGRAGPRGRLCNVSEAEGGGYDCVATFSAPAVLAYLDLNLEGGVA